MDLAPSPTLPGRTALVHDFLVSVRGAERVFLEICDLYPEADIFSPIYDEEGMKGRLSHRHVHTSFLQRFRPTAKSFRAMLPLYPAAVESFDLSGYDLVISSSSAWAHAVVCDPRSVHVSYCHNPFRYAWNERHRALSERRSPLSRAVLSRLFSRWREWDWIAAQRVDHFLTNSPTTQMRIRSYFGRDSEVLHPPVDTSRFAPAEEGEHYLVLSELMSHKRIDTAVRAFNELGLPLTVVGGGPELGSLRRLAAPNVTFTGRVDDSVAANLLTTCRALVVTAVEEFGIAAVEAQAAGRPVLATRGGGALETVLEGITGALWEGGPSELAACVRGFDTHAVDPSECVRSAARFDSEVFRRRLPAAVASARADALEASGTGPRHEQRSAGLLGPRRPGPDARGFGQGARRGTSTS